VTWYELRLAMIAVSGMSYVSYLIQTYFLPNRGLLGGRYSSTTRDRRAGSARVGQRRASRLQRRIQPADHSRDCDDVPALRLVASFALSLGYVLTL
jgi:hypothetical protein